MPLVSAAITTYNRARYLAEAVESIFAQTVQDLEVIVVDDGSTDETEAVLAPYRDRIRYVRQENGGRAAARNAAVKLARGELIGFCDSDDRWCPDRLARQLEALADAPRAGMVHGQVELIDEAGRRLPERTAAHREVFAHAHRRPATYAHYAANCRCLSSTILVRREVFERVGLYDETLPIEDYDFYLRLLLDFEVVFLDWPPLAQYRLHDAQIPQLQLGLGQIRTAEKHLALLRRRRNVPQATRARRNFHLMIARSWRVLGYRRRALPSYARALAARAAWPAL